MGKDSQTWSPDYVLVFDGGSLNNPGFGYGSYQLRTGDGRARVRRLEFGHGVTNNQAEYMALIGGLRDLVASIETEDRRPGEFGLEVRGDSSLVLNQLSGRWRTKHPGLKSLFLEARGLLDAFGRTRLTWTPRSESVKTLGH